MLLKITFVKRLDTLKYDYFAFDTVSK